MTPNNVLERRVREVNALGRVALCGYFMAGYPDPDTFYQAVRSAGAIDVIEYGVPSGDPNLNGVTIADAHRLLNRQRGIYAEPALALIGGVGAPQPSFVMTYTQVGRALEGFLKLCARNGLSGILVSDIGSEEARKVAAGARSLDLAVVRLVDGLGLHAELERTALEADLVYLKVSRGATGEPLDFVPQREKLESALARLRATRSDLIVAAGIGVQTPEHVAALTSLGVNMVLVGTKVVELIARGPDSLREYLSALRAATRIGI